MRWISHLAAQRRNNRGLKRKRETKPSREQLILHNRAAKVTHNMDEKTERPSPRQKKEKGCSKIQENATRGGE